MIDAQKIAAFRDLQKNADLVTSLESQFFETEDYVCFRDRVFLVLTGREARMKLGKTELTGAALIGPAGIGKTRMVAKIVAEYRELAEQSGGCNFGTNILSITIPGRATIKETCHEILREVGYSVVGGRDEGYLINMVVTKLEQYKIAALHLDELQDSGRYLTGGSMKHFAVRIRNFMQKKNWPVCIIVTGTIEAKTIINQDKTFLRRLRPIEVLPMVLEKEGKVMQLATKKMLAENNLPDNGMLDETEFQKILMHAAGYRFGMAIEIAIEAIGLAKLARDEEINMDHFAEAYFVRMNCDDEMNPFVSRFWKSIDTFKAMDRYIQEDKNRRKKLPRT